MPGGHFLGANFSELRDEVVRRKLLWILGGERAPEWAGGLTAPALLDWLART